MNKLLTILVMLVYSIDMEGQNKMYSLNDLLTLAEQSNDYIRRISDSTVFENKQRLFAIKVLPTASISANLPSMNNSITSVIQPDGSNKFVDRFSATSNVSMTLSQLIPFTGGTVQATTSLVRLDNYKPSRSTSYNLNLINLSYSQNLSGYNSYKWEKKQNQIEIEQNKVSFIQKKEDIYAKVTSLFFDLYLSQEQCRILEEAQELSMLLYSKAEAFYKQGRISYESLLDAKIEYQTARINNTREELAQKKATLMNYLNMKDGNFDVDFSDQFFNMELKIDETEVICRAIHYSADISKKMTDIQNALQLKQIKSYGAPSISLSFSNGYNSSSEEFKSLFGPYNTQMSFAISISIPLLNWSKYKLQYKNAMEGNRMSELSYNEQIADIETSCRYELNHLHTLQEEIENHNELILLMKRKMANLKKKIEYGTIEISELSKLKQNLIKTQIERVRKIQAWYSLIFKYRQMALYDLLAGCPIYE